MGDEIRKWLFICGANRRRSPTAEHVFSTVPGCETRSAGLRKDSDIEVSKEDIEWADTIFAMERGHAKKLRDKFPKALKDKKLIVLGIKDNYEYMEPDLIALLKQKLSKSL